MTHDSDQRIADLLREDAPAERDPMFRVGVLDRLERAKYRRRLTTVIACAVALAAIALLGVSVGGAVRETTSVLLVVVALATAYFVVAPAVMSLLARLRT